MHNHSARVQTAKRLSNAHQRHSLGLHEGAHKLRKMKSADILSVMIGVFPWLLFSSWVGAAELGDDFLPQFLVGEYHIVGKYLDAQTTYLGHATIQVSGAQLVIERTIDGKTVVAHGRIEKTHEDVQVLRTRFLQDQTPIEQTCLISSDLDNYARITCYSYSPHTKTTDPGLEAYFYLRQ
jgi:hypothetical protein